MREMASLERERERDALLPICEAVGFFFIFFLSFYVATDHAR